MIVQQKELLLQRRPSQILRRVAKLFFDPQQLIVFRHPVRAGGSAGFDLAHVEGYREVGNGGVFGLAGAM